MLVFENSGEIDPRLISLIGVNVKERPNAIGYFGTGLKYAISCLKRWGEDIVIQSGLSEFGFRLEKQRIRNQDFEVLIMFSAVDALQLGFTTELGKRWEPWMVYRELWCNMHDEPAPNVYETAKLPTSVSGKTRVVVSGKKIEAAHQERAAFILAETPRRLLNASPEVEIYEGESDRIFYRGISVQTLGKPSIYTYNVLESLPLTEDRTAGSWATDPIIARGLSKLENETVIDATLTAPSEKLESRLDYDYVYYPGNVWASRAQHLLNERPLAVPMSVRKKFVGGDTDVCPSCNRPL